MKHKKLCLTKHTTKTSLDIRADSLHILILVFRWIILQQLMLLPMLRKLLKLLMLLWKKSLSKKMIIYFKKLINRYLLQKHEKQVKFWILSILFHHWKIRIPKYYRKMSIKLHRKICSKKVWFFLEMIIKNYCIIDKCKVKYNNKVLAIQ